MPMPISPHQVFSSQCSVPKTHPKSRQSHIMGGVYQAKSLSDSANLKVHKSVSHPKSSPPLKSSKNESFQRRHTEYSPLKTNSAHHHVSRTNHYNVGSLASVVDYSLWVERLTSDDETLRWQAKTILTQDLDAVRSALMHHFPGPIVGDWMDVKHALALQHYGPMLECVSKHGKKCEAALLGMLGKREAKIRFFALLCLYAIRSDAYFGEPLGQQLISQHPSLRQLAVRVALTSRTESYFKKVIEWFSCYLDQITNTLQVIMLIEALGNLRHILAVPVLISRLNDRNQSVVIAVKQSLARVALDDRCGIDVRAWLRFYEAHRNVARSILIARALSHPNPEIQQYAEEELDLL